MRVHALQLTGFRNLASQVVEPGEQLNVIWGNNGQGKTSLLEAIFFLANLKSFRTSRVQDLIQKGANGTSLSARIEAEGTQHRLDVSLTGTVREKRLDGKVPSSNSEIYALLRPILFAPDHVGILQGGPGLRRDLLDRAIFISSPAYLNLVLEYGRVVRQRNRLLKDEQIALLTPWTQALVDLGARIRQQRNDYVNFIRTLFQQAYAEIVESKEAADLGEESRLTLNELRDQLTEEVEQSALQERRLKSSLAGPHRDDLSFSIEGLPAKSHASQGQQRSLILAFKMAQTRLLEQQTGQVPVLLLDDMTSELDAQREQTLIRFLSESGGQVFLTTTHRDLFSTLDPSRIGFHRMENGVLISE